MGGSESIRNFLGLAMSLRVESIYIVRRRRVKKKFLVFFFFSKFFTRPVRGHHTRRKCMSPWTREVYHFVREIEIFAHVTRECRMKSKTCLHLIFFRPAAPARRAASIVFPCFPKRKTCGATLDQPAPQFQTGLQRSRPRKSAGPEACAKETSCTHCTAAHYVSAPIHYVMAHPLLHQQAFWNVERSVCPVWFLYVYRRMPSHVPPPPSFDVIRHETSLVERNGITVYKKVHARILIPRGFVIWDLWFGFGFESELYTPFPPNTK